MRFWNDFIVPGLVIVCCELDGDDDGDYVVLSGFFRERALPFSDPPSPIAFRCLTLGLPEFTPYSQSIRPS
jgi:hypothetical protein